MPVNSFPDILGDEEGRLPQEGLGLWILFGVLVGSDGHDDLGVLMVWDKCYEGPEDEKIEDNKIEGFGEQWFWVALKERMVFFDGSSQWVK